jgi:signal transduction histidine kinase
MNFLYFVPQSDRPRLVQHLVAFGPERTVATLEHQVDLPEHGQRWLQRTDRAIMDASGRIFEFQSVERDITERKRMETQILAAQAHLIQAARMATIGEMASGVAHQIYNPLTTIIADAQILLRSLPPDHAERESAEAIEQAGWRLQQVVQRLMEFSRPSSETLTSVSVNETLQSALSLMREQIEAAGCVLEAQLADRLPVIQGSPNQLENLWLNLLLLAREAVIKGNGHKIRVISATTMPPTRSPAVIVEIHDDGLPIPEGQLSTIFEPNFVGPTSGRGTGMELSICREIVRQHGGQIIAESKTCSAEEMTTIFRITLPV